MSATTPAVGPDHAVAETVHAAVPERAPVPWAGLATLVGFLALFVLGGVINSVLSKGGGYPLPGDPLAEVRQWRAVNGDTVRLTGVIGALGGLLLIWHGSWMSTVVRVRGRDDQLARLSFAGGLIAGLFLLFGGMLQWVVESPDTLGDLPLMGAIDRLIYATTGPGSVVGLALLVGAASVALARSGLIPAWLARIGYAATALALLSLVMLLPEGGETFGFVSPARFPALLWLLATAVLAGRRLDRGAHR